MSHTNVTKALKDVKTYGKATRLQQKKKSSVFDEDDPFALSDESADIEDTRLETKKQTDTKSHGEERSRKGPRQQNALPRNLPAIHNKVIKPLTRTPKFKQNSARKVTSFEGNNSRRRLQCSKRKVQARMKRNKTKNKKDSSIEMLRKDMSWKEKVSLLMPKMDFLHAEQFSEVPLRKRFISPPRLHLNHEEILMIEESEDEEDQCSSSDYTYTWVTESKTTSTDSKDRNPTSLMSPSVLWPKEQTIQNVVEENGTESRARESTPDKSAGRHSVSLGLLPANLSEKSNHSSTMALEMKKKPKILNSSQKTGALDLMHVKFPTDISSISIETQAKELQKQAESTPINNSISTSGTPTKNGGNWSKRRKLAPKSSTLLFTSDYVGIEDVIPDLSVIRNTGHDSSLPSIGESTMDDKMKEKLQKTAEVKTKDNRGRRVVTSTPTSRSCTMFETELTAVQRELSDQEMSFNESSVINSQEIVPDDTIIPQTPEKDKSQKILNHSNRKERLCNYEDGDGGDDISDGDTQHSQRETSFKNMTECRGKSRNCSPSMKVVSADRDSSKPRELISHKSSRNIKCTGKQRRQIETNKDNIPVCCLFDSSEFDINLKKGVTAYLKRSVGLPCNTDVQEDALLSNHLMGGVQMHYSVIA